MFWKLATGHVVQNTSLFNNVRQMTLETWKKNKCDKIKSLKTNWMIKRTSIIPINDKIKTNTTFHYFWLTRASSQRKMTSNISRVLAKIVVSPVATNHAKIYSSAITIYLFWRFERLIPNHLLIWQLTYCIKK